MQLHPQSRPVHGRTNANTSACARTSASALLHWRNAGAHLWGTLQHSLLRVVNASLILGQHSPHSSDQGRIDPAVKRLLFRILYYCQYNCTRRHTYNTIACAHDVETWAEYMEQPCACTLQAC